MAIYTLTTTVRQDNALQRFVSERNAAERALNPLWVDLLPQDMAQTRFGTWLTTLAREYEQRKAEADAEKLPRLDAADKATVDAILGRY